MCSISDIYNRCVAKECDDHELFSYRERNAAQIETVCGGPPSGLLLHNTSHRRAVWSIAMLSPTSVP